MANNKTEEEILKEKEQRKMAEQKTENVFEDKSVVPNEQNRFKDTEAPRR